MFKFKYLTNIVKIKIIIETIWLFSVRILSFTDKPISYRTSDFHDIYLLSNQS